MWYWNLFSYDICQFCWQQITRRFLLGCKQHCFHNYETINFVFFPTKELFHSRWSVVHRSIVCNACDNPSTNSVCICFILFYFILFWFLYIFWLVNRRQHQLQCRRRLRLRQTFAATKWLVSLNKFVYIYCQYKIIIFCFVCVLIVWRWRMLFEL